MNFSSNFYIVIENSSKKTKKIPKKYGQPCKVMLIYRYELPLYGISGSSFVLYTSLMNFLFTYTTFWSLYDYMCGTPPFVIIYIFLSEQNKEKRQQILPCCLFLFYPVLQKMFYYATICLIQKSPFVSNSIRIVFHSPLCSGAIFYPLKAVILYNCFFIFTFFILNSTT